MKKTVILAFLLLVSRLVLNGQTYGTLTGTIKNPQGITISHAVIESKENLIRCFTDQNGNFSLRIPANREIKLTIFRDQSYLDTTIAVKLAPDEEQRVNVVLQYNAVLLKPVSITKDVRENYRILDPQLVTQVPSPTGNIVSLLKTFGGVYSPNELSSQYNVRGGNFDENLVYVNDIEIHRPFLVRNAQQEGLGFVNSDLTKSVKFSAGGFEAKYGDKMSSVLDVEYKTPAVGYRTSATLSLLGASIHTEGNVANKFTYLIGVRYKSNAYLLNSLETKGDYKPRFFDTQMLLTWNLSSKWSVDLLGNFTRNVYLFTPSSRTTNFGTIFDAKQLTVDYEGEEADKYENYLGAVTLHFKPNKNNKYKLILSSYYAKESETYDILAQYNLADIEVDLGSSSNDITNVSGISGIGSSLEHARNYITAVVSAADLRGEHKVGKHNINWGVKIQHEYVDDQLKEWTMTDSSGYSLPDNPGTPGEEVPLNDPSRELIIDPDSYVNASNQLNTIRVSGFAQDTWTIDSAGHFILNAGVRYTFWSYNKELNISPRMQFTYNPKWDHDWLFHLRGGCYHQSPFYREMRNQYGELNSDIKSQRSYQVVAAAEYAFKIWDRPFKFSTEAYYKYLDHLISYTVDNVKIVYSGKNNAMGYAAGIDFRLSGEFVHGLESWISMSLMKTEEDIDGDYITNDDGTLEGVGYLPRPTDQRFAINIFFQDHFPRVENFRVHLNFVFASRLPYSIPNQERKSGLTVDRNGNITYLRTSTWYRRVDIGFSYRLLAADRDKTKHKSKFIRQINDLNVYFEVFNLLNTNNVSSYTWIKDIYNQMRRVPDYLTQRLINLKIAISI